MKPCSRTVAMLAAALLMMPITTACSTLGIDGGTSERARLDRNRAKWRQHDFSAYRFTYATECFCPSNGAIVIEVRDAMVVGAGHAGSAEPLPIHVHAHLPTVDSLFAIVERAIAVEVDLLEVEYHQGLGHPTRIAIDHAFNRADDEIVHTVSALMAVTAH